MQNPLLRLTRYRSGDVIQKENQATEMLAACLQLSSSFRAEFIKWLFCGNEQKRPKPFSEPDGIEILTQFFTDGSGIPDLLLKKDGCAVLVEVKVDAKEREPRHKLQLDNYEEYLRPLRGGALFTLVRDPDPSFKHPAVLKRHTWSELLDMGKAFISASDNTTDVGLIEALRDYLNVKEIVRIMDYTKLVDYGKGWAAETALAALFDRTTELLKAAVPDLREPPRNLEQKGTSPSFQFGRRSWDNLFGKGWNNKVYAHFCTPATETDLNNSNKCEFRFEIYLWDKAHAHDWNYTSKLMPKWFQHLNHQGRCACYSKRKWEPLEWKDGQALDPENHYVFHPDRAVPFLPVSEDSLRDIERFANDLTQRIATCINLVDGLQR
jgi:hypothetical protein